MTEVSQEEIQSWMALLLLKDTGVKPGESIWTAAWQRKLDIPMLNTAKHTTWDNNVEKITHYLKVKFNMTGRKRSLYKEWPRAILCSTWFVDYYFRYNLGKDNLDGTFTLYDGYGNGSAIYRKDLTNDVAYLVAYEGTVK